MQYSFLDRDQFLERMSGTPQLYEYIPDVIDKDLFFRLFHEAQGLVAPYYVYNRLSRRVSCLFTDFVDGKPTKIYYAGNIRHYDWAQSSTLQTIRSKLQSQFPYQFAYCLLHVYRDGSDSIGYHKDAEAMNTAVVSVSLGATRQFKIRPQSQPEQQATKPAQTFFLKSGDLIHMLPGCQRLYEHCLAPEPGLKEPRINLTFRLNDSQDKLPAHLYGAHPPPPLVHLKKPTLLQTTLPFKSLSKIDSDSGSILQKRFL